MFRLTACALKNAVCNRRFLTAMILITITASFFCINVTYGYGESVYHSMRNGSDYSALTIADPDAATADTDMIPYLQKRFGYKVGAALYVTRASDGPLLVGWDGDDPVSMWFSSANGRFFTAAELDAGAAVAYIDSTERASLPSDSPTVTIDGGEYGVVGCGGVREWNLFRLIGDGSPQDIVRERDDAVHVIPYRAFTDGGHTPELILLRLDGMTHTQIKTACRKLADEFPSGVVTMPKDSSDDMRAAEVGGRAVCGLILAVIILLSMKNIMDEWLSENRVLFSVFLICGVSRRRMRLVILLEYLIIFVFAMLSALLVQRLCLGSLSLLGADAMPTAAETVLALLIVYALTVAASWHKIGRVLRISKMTERM